MRRTIEVPRFEYRVGYELYLFETDFEVHPVAYVTGAEGSLPGSKAAGE
jgi:hypothetical protein